MNYFVLTILIFIGCTIFVLLLIRKWLNETKPSSEIVEWLKDLGKRVETSTNNFNIRLDKAAFVIAQVQKNIGEFSEIGRGMKELQEFLQSPKLRGNLGEAILKDLLQQFLPKASFTLQYVFNNGQKVDAVITTSQGLIPIDAKFPMENFRKMINSESAPTKEQFKKEFCRDVKKHIQDISKKYIVSDEGTVDYALMYIPSEAVYYEIINDQELYHFSVEKRVLIVSPMSFYAYLKTILMSFEGQKIEKRAGEILTLLQSLQKDQQKAEEAFSVLNRHITNAYNQISVVSKFFLSFGNKLNSTRMLSESEETKKLK